MSSAEWNNYIKNEILYDYAVVNSCSNCWLRFREEEYKVLENKIQNLPKKNEYHKGMYWFTLPSAHILKPVCPATTTTKRREKI